MATVTSLGFSIFSRYHGDGVNRARRSLAGLNRDLERNQRQLSAAAKGFSPLATAAAALAPALIPVGQVVAGVTAATAVMGATAGTALGAYGLAMGGAIKRTFEMKAAGKALAPSQQLFINRVSGMKAAWTKFLVATQPMTLQVAGVAIQGVTAAIGRMAPVVRAVHPILLGIAKDFRSWASGAGLGRFITIVRTQGVPALAGLVRAGKNVITALGIGFRALVPLIQPLVRWIERGAVAFRKWAEGGGFNRFANNIHANGPKVAEMLGQLVKLFARLGTAMAGLGPFALSLTIILLKMLNALPIPVLQAMIVAYLAWRAVMIVNIAVLAVQNIALRVASFQFFLIRVRIALLVVWMAALRVATIIATAAQWLWNAAMTANPIGIVIVAVAALVGAIVFLATQTRFFGIVWNAVWSGVKTAGIAIWTGLRAAGIAIWTGMRIAWTAITWAMVFTWRHVWTAIRAFGVATWSILKIVGAAMWHGMQVIWTGIVWAMVFTWRHVWTAIRAFGVATWNVLKILGKAMWHGMQVIWTGIVWAMVFTWQHVWKVIRAFGVGTWNVLKIVGKAMWHGMWVIWQGITWGMHATWVHVWKAIRAFGVGTWNALKVLGKAMWHGLWVIAQAIWWGMHATWVHVWRAIRAFGVATWNALKTIGRAMWHGMYMIFFGIVWAMRSTWRAAWTAILNIGRHIWSALKTSLFSVLGAMRKAFSAAVHGIAVTWNKMKAIVAAPVRFFVNTVYNNGLRKAWNNTAGKIPGVPDLPGAHVNFAQGGPVRGKGGPRDDRVPALLSAGEYVINARAVKKLGPQRLDALNGGKGGPTMTTPTGPNATNPQPGFFLGGLIPNPIDWIKAAANKVKDLVGGALEWGADVTRDIGGAALKLVMKPVYGLFGKIGKDHDSGGFGDAAAHWGKVGLDKLIEFAIGKMPEGGANFQAGLTWAKTQVGKHYQWGGNGNPSWDCSGFMSAIESVIRGEKPHRRWATGAFGGSKGPSGWKRNAESPFQIGITNRGVGHTAGTLLGHNVECSGGPGCRVDHGARGAKNGMFDSVWGLTGVKGSRIPGGHGVARWRPMAIQAMHMAGLFHGIERFLALMGAESGGNPFAVNTTDSNAARGDPSRGLMQVIGATFRAYHVAGTSWDILDPLANMAAAANYIKHRYGGHIPGSPYAEGGLVSSYDRGGYLPTGLSLAYNGTGRPEPVGHDMGTHLHFENCNFSGGQRQFEDMVVRAVSEAKRKNRI